MVLSKHRVLSREEEVELSRSKKKVKDVHHADFNDGASDGGHSQSHQNAWGSTRASFKEKLVGEMPRAFAKAFDFSDLMDAEAESDDEVSDLREGLTAVKLSRVMKLRIKCGFGFIIFLWKFTKLRFEQQVVYEGIHKLCFGCGRIGHKKDACPHLVWKLGSSVRGDNVELGDPRRSRTLPALDSTIDGSGTSGFQLEGKSSGEAGASNCRNQSKLVVNEGLVYQAADGDVETDLSDDGGKHKSGGSLSHDTVVEASSDQRTVTGGGAEGSLEEDTADTFMRDDSYNREKEVGSPANNHFSKRNVLVGKDGMELEEEGGVDASSR
nr:hypothetical protein CFP56_76274 [Quercus suber]